MNSDHTPVNLEVRALNQQDVAYDDGRPLARDTAPGWKAALVVCALMAIFVIAVQGLVQPWIDLMLPFLEEADVKSEFAPHEQASNYLLLIMMAAGIAGHRFAVEEGIEGGAAIADGVVSWEQPSRRLSFVVTLEEDVLRHSGPLGDRAETGMAGDWCRSRDPRVDRAGE